MMQLISNYICFFTLPDTLAYREWKDCLLRDVSLNVPYEREYKMDLP
jgi:hypothetical protein